MARKLGEVLGNLGVPGILVGIGAVALAPLVIPAVGKVGKPIAKAAIKGGIAAYEQGKRLLAETGEVLEDLVAEAQAELEEERAQQAIEIAEPPPEVES